MEQKKGFHYKKDIPENELDQYVAITDYILFFLNSKMTQFGPLYDTPYLVNLFEFLKLKIYNFGAYNYNDLGLSAQVPMRLSYVTSSENPELINSIKKGIFRHEYVIFAPSELFKIFNTNSEFVLADGLLNATGSSDQSSDDDTSQAHLMERHVRILTSIMISKKIDSDKLFNIIDNNYLFLNFVFALLKELSWDDSSDVVKLWKYTNNILKNIKIILFQKNFHMQKASP